MWYVYFLQIKSKKDKKLKKISRSLLNILVISTDWNRYKMPQYQDEYEEDGPISSSLRAICSFLGFVSFVLTCFVLGAPYWRVTTSWDSAAAYTNIWEFEGLFLSCVKSGAQKQSQCFQLQTLMMQPGMNGYDDYLKSIYSKCYSTSNYLMLRAKVFFPKTVSI